MLVCDTASFANLLRFQEQSSEPTISSADAEESSLKFEESGSKNEKHKFSVARTELEDSVMAIDWSAADAWTYAGVSYNGTFFLNTVPSKTKYEILI